MPSAKTISKTATGYPDHLDFRSLREVGLDHIRQLSGDIWTDHNLHDPGITILEALCYALLDLGYRTNHNIRDLIARNYSTEPNETRFFTAAEILGNNPITISDYRRLLLDIPGVRNAWLEIATQAETNIYIDCSISEGNQMRTSEPGEKNTSGKKVFLNGLYRVFLELDPIRPQDVGNTCGDGEVPTDRILNAVRACLHSHRNLDEDFIDICILQDEQIGFCAQLELDPGVDPEDALTDMFIRIRDWLSPEPRFYTLQEMLVKGKKIEQIFEGRPLRPESHGFVDLEELDEARPNRLEIHVSDLYRVMLNNPAENQNPPIRAIRGLSLFNYIDGQAQTTGVEWCLHLTEGYRPVISPELSQIRCLKDGIPVNVDMNVVASRVANRLTNASKIKRRPYELNLLIPEGQTRNLSGYFSIQRDFPAVYGIGEGGIPDSASLTRKAQALQLKSYLLFFDQLLANYLAQLAQARHFFALKPADRPIQSYFSGNIDNVPDLENLLRGAKFDQNGEQITGQSVRFKRGESIFFPEKSLTIPHTVDKLSYADYQVFDTPQQRDDVIGRLIAAFENEDYKIEIIEDDCKNNLIRFHTPVVLPNGTTLTLLSISSFKDFNTVKTEAEAITFLFLSANYYRTINLQSEGKYSFDLNYNPLPYADFLQMLAETPELALERRNRFLDHLLARFAEDFSEYALLQFSSGEQQSLASLIEDKENFLGNYPAISQNRSAGFDYTDYTRIWDTDNVTGLERRAGHLMGIENWNRHTLAPFFVETTTGGKRVVLRDFCGRILWQSLRPIDDPAAFIAAVQAAASKKSNYRSINCESFGRYGFELMDAEGCTLALHPDFYGDPELRDRKCEYLTAIYANPGGFFIQYTKTEAGWFFYLEKDGQTLAKSAQPYGLEQEALVAWIHFSTQSTDLDNFHITEDPYGRGYGVQVLAADGITILAFYPGFFAEISAAETLIGTIQKCINENRPQTQLSQNDSAWSWQFKNEDGQVLLESSFLFTERGQAGMALLHALSLAAEPNTLAIQKTNAGWTYALNEHHAAQGGIPAQTITLATHPGFFSSQNEAEQAAADASSTAAPASLFFRKIGVINHTFRLQWFSKGGTLLLQGSGLYRTEAAAELGFEELIRLACKPEQLEILHEDGFHIRLLNAFGAPIARHPEIFYDYEHAAAAAADIVHEALTQKQPKPVLEKTGQAWYFRLTDKQGEAVLESSALFADRTSAEAALVDALFFARTAENWQTVYQEKPPVFSLELQNDKGQSQAYPTILFPDAAARDAALAAWRDWFSAGRIPLNIVEQAGSWEFAILRDDIVVFEGVNSYATEDDAALALEKTLTLASNGANLLCTQEQGHCLYSFDLVEPGHVDPLANHPEFYPDKVACEAAAASLAGYFAENQPPYKLVEEPVNWQIELLWETCDERIAQAFISTGSFPEKADAEYNFGQLATLYEKLTVITIPGDPPRWTIEAPGGLPVFHPRLYATETEAKCVLADLKKYLHRGGRPYQEILPVKPCRFRLLKDNSTMAVFNETYPDKAERDTALKAEKDKILCGEPHFSTLELCYGRAVKQGNRYCFQLLTYDLGVCAPKELPGETVLWKSAQTYASQEEAEAAFDMLYLDILPLAAVGSNYIPDCNGPVACFYYLEDPANPGQILVRTPDFPPGTDLETEVKKRLCHARTYPIVKEKEDCYGFRLGDPVSNRSIWISSYLYASPQEAMEAFERFLATLAFPDNYYPVDQPNKPEYGFELREAGLCETENVVPFVFPSDDTDDNPDSPSDDSDNPDGPQPGPTDPKSENWDRLEQCLVGLGNTTSFSVFLDEYRQCRFGLQLVSDRYRLARYPGVYHNFRERELARDWLFETIRCQVMCQQEFQEEFCLKNSPCFPSGWKWLCDYWNIRSDLLAETENPEDCCTVEGKINPVKVIELMALARAGECYVLVQDPGGDKKTPAPMCYGLMDKQGRIVAFGTLKTLDEAALEKWKEEAISRAWEFPLVRRAGGFGFQLANGVESVLLESIPIFSSPVAAGRAFCRLLELLPEKTNYSAYESSDCGPFGIDITDPAEIKAKHPATYPCRADALKMAQALSVCMDAEGFHLVEHLLLRPMSAESPLFNLGCLDCGDLELAEFWDPNRVELGCLIAEEPYSFQCTVIIPYWGRRFRNLNFRDFFERTLRREAPAHVLLRFAWITPKQMQAFERCWRRWLESNALGRANCAWNEDLKLLIEQLEQLKNAYPPSSSFADRTGDDGGSIIVLDQSILPN